MGTGWARGRGRGWAVHVRRDSHWNGRHASYWNALLFKNIFTAMSSDRKPQTTLSVKPIVDIMPSPKQGYPSKELLSSITSPPPLIINQNGVRLFPRRCWGWRHASRRSAGPPGTGPSRSADPRSSASSHSGAGSACAQTSTVTLRGKKTTYKTKVSRFCVTVRCLSVCLHHTLCW